MTGIAIQELSEVDLDDLDHLDRGGLSQHFRRIAVRATAGQLRSVLGQSAPADEDGPMDLRSLVDSYVDQYTRTAMRLRTARTRFSALSLGVPDSPSIPHGRSEEHTSELQSLMHISYDVFCLKQKKQPNDQIN